jgi:GT2 family glycosyltransferase
MTAPFSRPEVGLVYGRQTGDHRTHFSEQQVLRRWFPATADEDQRDPFCNNANCAVRTAAWRGLPYDEELTGLEDVDWAKRALSAGWKIVYEARALVAHVHDEKFSETRVRYRREALAHRNIFHDQRMALWSAIGLFLLAVGRDYLAAIPSGALVRNLFAIPTFRAAQYLGAWEGFRHRGEVSTALRRRLYYPKGFHASTKSRRGTPR